MKNTLPHFYVLELLVHFSFYRSLYPPQQRFSLKFLFGMIKNKAAESCVLTEPQWLKWFLLLISEHDCVSGSAVTRVSRWIL